MAKHLSEWNLAEAGNYAASAGVPVNGIFPTPGTKKIGSNGRTYIANSPEQKGSAVDLTADPVAGDGSATADWVFTVSANGSDTTIEWDALTTKSNVSHEGAVYRLEDNVSFQRVESPVASQAARDALADLKPGDFVVRSDNSDFIDHTPDGVSWVAGTDATVPVIAGDRSHTPRSNRSWIRRRQKKYDIRNYGAKADGYQSIMQALNLAAAAAAQDGGGDVILPPNKPLGIRTGFSASVASNVRIRGENSRFIMQEAVNTELFQITASAQDVEIGGFSIEDPNDLLDTGGVVSMTGVGGTYNRIKVHDIEWYCDNTGVEVAKSIVTLDTEFNDLKIIGLKADKAGYIFRITTPANINASTGLLVQKCVASDCSRSAWLIGGDLKDIRIFDNEYYRFQTNVDPKHPLHTTTGVDSSYEDIWVKGNTFEGIPGIVATSGLNNGASGDMIPIRQCTRGIVERNIIRHWNEVAITVTTGSSRITVRDNVMIDGDSVGVLVGSPVNAAVADIIVRDNDIINAGIDVSGSATEGEAGIRIANCTNTVVIGNSMVDGKVGIKVHDDAVGTKLSNDNKSVNMSINDYEFEAAVEEIRGPFANSDIDYALEFDGATTNWIESPIIAGVNATDTIVDTYIHAEFDNGFTDDVMLLGATTNRVRIRVQADGSVEGRFHSAAGFQTVTSTAGTVTGGRYHFWLEFTATDMNLHMSQSLLENPRDITDWQQIATSSYAATTVAAAVATNFRPSPGSLAGTDNAVTYTPFKLISVQGYFEGVRRWFYDARYAKTLYNIGHTADHTDPHGITFINNGTIPVSAIDNQFYEKPVAATGTTRWRASFNTAGTIVAASPQNNISTNGTSNGTGDFDIALDTPLPNTDVNPKATCDLTGAFRHAIATVVDVNTINVKVFTTGGVASAIGFTVDFTE